ncbi:hypothetical protein SAMN05421780_1193 [Flexibacter flexilis DSM 6793]|uniref:Uncharacterized protein n=1 Tax=Flexibacter flexilis DSM 6793 TaxID=927664 RepID=A0A1I1P3J2_9BACT|nr:hypothetical protein [Flexibacter flexilis]SFD00530.1 hypothetical protein SAMN05421780_1193 [Flexibacter flexilis DSM 6793]
MKSIPLNLLLATMPTTPTFSIQFVTANRRTGEGGQLITLANACIAKNKATGLQRTYNQQPKPHKNPSHFKNRTRNIWCKTEKRFYKVHIYLILSFNGLAVRYGN